MLIVERAVIPLRVVLGMTFAVLVVLQTLSFPGQFAHMASEDPDLAYLRWPMTAFAAALILCGQIVIVCTWRLLTMVQRDQIFSRDALRWVDAIIGSVGAAAALLGGAVLYFGAYWGDPGVPMVFLILTLSAGSAALLILVMRSLLTQATGFRTDLEGVI